MNEKFLMLTPTKPAGPTPQPPHIGPTPPQPSGLLPPTSAPPTFPPGPSPGFEVDLGIVTLTNFSISNPVHTGALAALVSAIASAAAYRAVARSHQHKIDRKAVKKIESTFGAKIDKLGQSETTLRLPERLGLIDRFLNRKKASDYERVLREIEAIRKQIQEFQDEYRGRISPALEDAVLHLFEVSTERPPSIPRLLSALEGVRAAAARIGLRGNEIHLIRSMVHQLRRLEQAEQKAS